MHPSPTNQASLVTLDCTPDDFKNFIKSLLGKPQTITNSFSGEFDINRDDLVQFHHLLTNRITEQNKSSLIQFTATIVYDDNSTVTLNDLPSFESYNETKPLRSTSVSLSWAFLVQFENRKAPEKQEIDVNLSTIHFGLTGDVMPRFMPELKNGFIGIRINHTARSWASDIEALLSAQVKSIIIDDHKLKSWIYRHEDKISIGVFALLAISTVTCVLITGGIIHQNQLSRAAEIAAIPDLPKKIDSLTNLVSSGDWSRFTVYGLSFIGVMLILSLLISIAVNSLCDARNPSFITLTKKSEEYRKRELSKAKNRFTLFIGSIIMSLILGVSGNWIFSYFIQGWRP